MNVFVNGKSTIPNFKPGTIAGPLQLPAGSYDVKIFPAANTAGTGTPVIQATASVQAGQNVTLVAHLDAAGKPTLTPMSMTPPRSPPARRGWSFGIPPLHRRSTSAPTAPWPSPD